MTAAFAVIPAAALLYFDKPILALLCFSFIPALLLVTSPRASFFVFLISSAVFYRFDAGPLMVLPVDIAAALALIAATLDFLLRADSTIRQTDFDLPFILLITACVLSIPAAHNISYTLTPMLRILAIYLMFRVSFKLADEIGVAKVLDWFLHLAFLLSVINVIMFFASGGTERIFGPSWLTFQLFAMTSLPICLVRIIWTESTLSRFRYTVYASIIAVALAATQSRAPQLSFSLTLLVIIWFGWIKYRREGVGISPSILFKMGAALVIIGGITGVVGQEYFIGVIDRVAEFGRSLTNPEGTVALRIVLWGAAFQGFLSNPLTGIGIGNFRIIDQIIPEMRFAPVWYYIEGFSAHNVVLQFLAETGILGAVSLLILALRGVRHSFANFMTSQSIADTRTSASVFILMFQFSITIFFMRAWTWGQDGYLMALFFGLTAAHLHRIRLSRNKMDI